ncbi:MAG: futalosine hydrolase [Saprospiraceae bacterium]|jgi:futalosine hydrolase
MLLTIVSATPFEIAPTTLFLKENFEGLDIGLFQKNKVTIRTIITGVGMPLTAFQLGLYLSQEQPDLLINAGIAGAFNKDLALGAVVNITSDRFGDLGVEEADGTFTDVHEMGLIQADDKPFENGILSNTPTSATDFLPKVSGLTINKVHGYQPSIDQLIKKYQVDVETMEGAAVFLACLQSKVDFLAIRSISNYVESRNRDAWEIALAIENLNEVLKQIIGSFIQE